MKTASTNQKSLKRSNRFYQIRITTLATIFILLAFIPIVLMLFLSFKDTAQFFGSFWAFPKPMRWSNYAAAWKILERSMWNTIFAVALATITTVTLAGMGGYVFARLEFPHKKFLFMMLLALMMIPGVLTLTPMYKMVDRMGLKNTWWALWFPWVSGGQIMGIYMCRTFIGGQPASLFESARIDGATEFQAFYKIAVPLAKPILATLVVMNMINFYNDYVWPLLVLDGGVKQVVSVALRAYSSRTGTAEYGQMIAGFVVATIPLLLMFCFSARLYIEGLTSGAIKA